jgi:multidrug efflux system outer membrane protein
LIFRNSNRPRTIEIPCSTEREHRTFLTSPRDPGAFTSLKEHTRSNLLYSKQKMSSIEPVGRAENQPVLRAFLLFAVSALFGCTMIPKYERPAPPVAAQFPEASETKPGPAASDIAWRDFVREERLKQLLEAALVNNRDMRVAILNVEQSRAQYRITRSTSFPTVDASTSYSRSQSSLASFPQGSGASTGSSSTFSFSQWNASIGTSSYEVDLWGRVRSLNKQALEKYFSTEEAQRAEQISLVSEVATEYFTLREAEEGLELSRQTLRAVEESYDVNKAMFGAGATNELDLREAEGQVQTARINVLTYQRQIEQAENYLVLLVGQDLPANLPAPRSFRSANLLTDIPAGLPSELLERRPDILEAEHTLKAANANIGEARAAFFPTITLTSSIGTTSSQLSELFGSGTGVWSFSPQITLPIFTGGKTRADLDAAEVSKRIEIANYEKAIQTAFREVADALVGVQSYAKQIEHEASLVNAQQKRYDIANIRYRVGAGTYLNVLTAQEDLYSAQQGLIQAQFNKFSSQISLYKALGGGWK